MKKTNVTLSVERSMNNDTASTYTAGFNKEETTVVANNERVVKLEEDFKGATVSSCDVKSTIETGRTQVLTNTSFAIEEDDEEVRTALDNGLHLPYNEKVEVKYAIGDSARSASINQTIATKAKESSSYNTDTEEAKVKVVIEESVNTRTEDVEQLMGEL